MEARVTELEEKAGLTTNAVNALETSVGAINAKVNVVNVKTDILAYAENLRTSGIHCIRARSVDETGAPGIAFSWTNGIILRTGDGDGAVIAVLLFNRGSGVDAGHVVAVNTKYSGSDWSGWRLISGDAVQ